MRASSIAESTRSKTLAPLLSNAGLCILPRIIGRQCDERQSAKGNALFCVVVEAEFDLVSAEDGTRHHHRTFGEAMDSGDKATNKAMVSLTKCDIHGVFRANGRRQRP